MSKIRKLIKTPRLFFRDYLNKRVQGNERPYSALKPKPNTVGKAVAKPVASIAGMDSRNFNRFKKYKYYLHNGEGIKAGTGQLNMWLPLLISIRVPFLLIIRDKNLYDWTLKNYSTIDVAYAKGPGDVGDLVALSRGVPLALYISSTGNNIHLVRFEEIRHCFIGHGDSEKASSAHKALRMFDEIWVAGQAHIDRFKNKPFNTDSLKFVKVGRPTLIDALQKSITPWQERGDTKILYLPTWEGSNYKNDYSSVRFAKQLLGICSTCATVHAKLHPFTGNRDKGISDSESLLDSAFKGDLKVSIIPSRVPLVDILDGYNFFVCDISSVVTECLALDAPIFLFYPKDVEIEIAASNIKFDDYCYVFSNLDELESMLNRVLSGDDFKKAKRREAIDYFIGLEETRRFKILEALETS